MIPFGALLLDGFIMFLLAKGLSGQQFAVLASIALVILWGALYRGVPLWAAEPFDA